MEDYQHEHKCIYQQLSSKSWEADSSIGQKSSCEEYAPHTAKCILGGVFFTTSVNFEGSFNFVWILGKFKIKFWS